jgi:hypothetical protein
MCGVASLPVADMIRRAGVLARRKGRPHSGGCPLPRPAKRSRAFALAGR